MARLYKLGGILNTIKDDQISIGGHWPSIDKLNKVRQVRLSYSASTSGDIVPRVRKPFRGSTIYIMIKYDSDIPHHLLGKKVYVWATIRPYNFIAADKTIVGWKLYLSRIEETTNLN